MLCTLSAPWAWRPAAVTPLAQTLGLTNRMRGALPAVFLLVAPAVHAGQTGAAVDFLYERPGSESCMGKPVAPEWDREMRERLPEFVALWKASGPGMTMAVERITGKPFAPSRKVTLTLCEIPSNSLFGVTVNMRYALRSFTASPVPLRYKLDTVFHEMLHEFVGRTTPQTSTLLASHSSETHCVRNHLHLLALQKAVLVRTADTAALEQVIAIDGLLPSGCYKRAWALVNDTPSTYQLFVAELAQ